MQNECVSCGRSAAAGSVRCACGGTRFRLVKSTAFERGVQAGRVSAPAAGSDTRSGVRRAIEARERECSECGAANSSNSESCARCGCEFSRALLGTIDRLLGRSGPSPSQSLEPRPGETVEERDARHRAIRSFAQTRAFTVPLQEERRGPRPIYALSSMPGRVNVVGYARSGLDAFEARSEPDRFERECQRVERCAVGYR